MPSRARLHIVFIIAAALAALLAGLCPWRSPNPRWLLLCLALALPASLLKIDLPGVTGALSVGFVFILIGVVHLSLPETLVLGVITTLVQYCWPTGPRLKIVQLAFNLAAIGLAVNAAWLSYHGLAVRQHVGPHLALLVAGIAFFVCHTLSMAVVSAWTDGKSVKGVWCECCLWSFPYYLTAAALAGLVGDGLQRFGWQTLLLVIPVLCVMLGTCRLYVRRLEDEKRHAREMAALNLRTIETLALAINAKDSSTHEHLRRVQLFAVEIGKELGLGGEQIEALRAAALLHDIGKLAVPEHIVSKPGRLSPEEFEKLKIHPVVGAEILERAQFPHPVAPIVRSHHERWDGTGYPDGLRGEEIPIGARILAAVDCLDALASDRRYRRALPLMDAMAVVAADAGTAFDPRVVEALQRRYVELERMAQEQIRGQTPLCTYLSMRQGPSPATGFEGSGTPEPGMDFLTLISSARDEVQMLFEVAHELGASLSLSETLSVLAVRLKRMIPYDWIAIYVRRDGHLYPEYVSGEKLRESSLVVVPMGHGLSGWVAENRRPILNGNAAVEPTLCKDPSGSHWLTSALAVPLEGATGVVGVLTLYRSQKEAFTRDHLRLLLAISSKIAVSIENALKYRQAEASATTDALTGLPNTRSLFLHLDRELARARRVDSSLAVLVCDLNGFKQVNDQYGHLEGNRLLKAVAAAMRDACREYDYVARMGGDEFVVVLPGATAAQAHATALRLAAVTRAVGRRIFGEHILSLSVGAALYPDDGTDAEQLLALADRRMYKIKRSQKSGIGPTGDPLEMELEPQTLLMQ